MKARTFLAAGAAAVVAVAGAGSASALVAAPALKPAAAGGNGADNGIHDQTTTTTHDCGNGRSITYDGPSSIWPPNHKLRNWQIVAQGQSSDNVTLTTTVSSDEPANMPGSGNTPTDTYSTTPVGADMGTGSAENDGQVRGERSGQGDGRTYTFKAHATFNDQSCDATFTATVPHDQGRHRGATKSRARRR